jgi:hypothetical protein
MRATQSTDQMACWDGLSQTTESNVARDITLASAMAPPIRAERGHLFRRAWHWIIYPMAISSHRSDRVGRSLATQRRSVPSHTAHR